GLRPGLLHALPQGPGDVTTVEREEGDGVEGEEHEVERAEEGEQEDALVLRVPEDVRARDLAGDPTDADDRHRALGVALGAAEGGLGDTDELLRDLHEQL